MHLGCDQPKMSEKIEEEYSRKLGVGPFGLTDKYSS